MEMVETTTYNNAPINYSVKGKGPWVVLLHGFLESLEIWNDFSDMLENEFSVLTIDLPGHGRSGMMGDVHTIPQMADAVMAVCNYLNINTFLLCGHSMGGYIGLELAARFPLKVSGLVLFHSQAAPDDEKAKENRERTINIVKLNHSGFIHQFIPGLFAEANRERLAPAIEKLRNRAAATSAKSIIASLEGMKQRNGSLDFLMETEIPTFVVVGRNDDRIPYNKVMAQAMMIKHAEVILLNDVGHMGFLEAPDKILPAVRDFFRRNLPLAITESHISELND